MNFTDNLLFLTFYKIRNRSPHNIVSMSNTSIKRVNFKKALLMNLLTIQMLGRHNNNSIY